MTPIEHVPFAYELGPLQLTGFGIAMLLAFIIGQIVSTEVMEQRGQESEIISDVTVASVIGGLFGAKLYYAILVGDISAMFSRSGFVFWGGLIGGIAGCALVVMLKKRRFTEVTDAVAPGLAAAYAIGRTGCWAVGDDYGRPWDGPLAVMFPDGAPPSTVANLTRQFGLGGLDELPPTQVMAVHPTQLYEVAMALVMFAILWRLRGHRHQAGWLFGAYCALQGVERIIVEVFRAKDDRIFGPFTIAQVIAVLFVTAGLAWMASRRRPAAAAA